jgi:hypothetical protein
VSNTDSFIEEVTEEVKRDRLFGMMKKYGWIGVVAVLGIVGGTGYSEYRKASDEATAQAFGDTILSALSGSDEGARVSALQAIETANPGAQAILNMLIASEQSTSGQSADAVAQLNAVADNAQAPQIYRQIASFKALTQAGSGLSAQDRRSGLQALAVPGQPLRLLAEEQLALIDIETGDAAAAVSRLEAISEDSEATAGLRRRAQQLIVALGGAPTSE